MRKVTVNGDIVYVVETVSVKRGIRSNNKTHEDEVIIFGFNARFRPDLARKYLPKEVASRYGKESIKKVEL